MELSYLPVMLVEVDERILHIFRFRDLSDEKPALKAEKMLSLMKLKLKSRIWSFGRPPNFSRPANFLPLRS